MSANNRTTLKFYKISQDVLLKNRYVDYSVYKRTKKDKCQKFIEKGSYIDDKIINVLKNEYSLGYYIEIKDKENYQKDVQKCLSVLIDNKTIPIEKKADVIYKIAYITVKDLYEGDLSNYTLAQCSSNIEDMIKFFFSDQKALNSMLDVTAYDYYTYKHSINVSAYAIGFAMYLDLDFEDIQIIGKAAMLHDIGKREIDNDIITKKGRLTEYEFELVKHHPALGVQILKDLGETNQLLLKIIEQHHEKEDGTGYPKGLKSKDIHFFSKIIAISDIFNALTTKRSYKDSMETEEAFKIMTTNMKGEICSKTLEKFIEFMSLK